jgi:hypothetical protein
MLLVYPRLPGVLCHSVKLQTSTPGYIGVEVTTAHALSTTYSSCLAAHLFLFKTCGLAMPLRGCLHVRQLSHWLGGSDSDGVLERSLRLTETARYTGLSITCSSELGHAQISTQKKYAQIRKKKKIFMGYFTPLKRFFAPKMLKSAPKWLKLTPEILKMPIFVTQFNFKVSEFRLTSTNCKQNASKLSWKAKQHVTKIGIKI